MPAFVISSDPALADLVRRARRELERLSRLERAGRRRLLVLRSPPPRRLEAPSGVDRRVIVMRRAPRGIAILLLVQDALLWRCWP